MRKSILMLMLGLILTLSSTAMAIDGMNYHDKAFNRDWELTPKTSEVSVRFTASITDAEAISFARDFSLTIVHNAMWNNFMVYSLKSEFDVNTINLIRADGRVAGAAIPGVDQEGFTKYYDPTEATVQFYRDLPEATCEEIIAEIGATIVKRQWTPNYYTISTARGKNVFETLEVLNGYSEVWFCEPSIYSFDDAIWTPDDPDFDQQWHLYNTGQESAVCVCTPYGNHDINARQAWDMTRGDRGTVIVIIDTGMDLTHPDLAGNLLSRGADDWDFADADNSPDDVDGHGTSCSGLAAAVADNAVGVAGVAPRCYLMPLRVNLTSGQNQNRADAINYARGRASDFDAMVISMSWRMSSGSFVAVEQACNDAYNLDDVLLLAAAGNSNSTTVDYPGRYASVCAIAATSPCDERKSTTSCDGENWWGTNYGNDLDFSAPGVLMYTTDIQGGGGYEPGDYMPTFNGTSSACPTAAGVAGLVRSIADNLTNVQVRTILQNSCDQVGGYTYTPKSFELGYGRLNAHRAVLAALKANFVTADPLDANMEALPPSYLSSSGNNIAGYFGTTSFGPEATILEESARASYNDTGYPMNSFDAVLYSNAEPMITCAFATLTDSVKISFAASGNTFYLEAYDSLGNLISSSSGVSGSGNNSFLNVTSASDNISYVVMHDTGNFFVLDDVMFARTYPVRAYMVPLTNNPKITVPVGGGSFNFWGVIENNSFSTQTPDLGIHLIKPNGTDSLVAVYNNVPVGAYQRLAFYNTTTVPAGAPSGMWAYRVEYGNLPSQLGGHQFGFYKSAVAIDGEEDSPVAVNDWSFDHWGMVSVSDIREPFNPNRSDLVPFVPAEFALNGSYPNPFNATTKIEYQLPASGNVTLEVYNILGQRVETLVNGYQDAGMKSVTWNASPYSSGVYFTKLSFGDKVATKKMMLVK